jgi:glycosyltransferase involved in cell wall biosynthesis
MSESRDTGAEAAAIGPIKATLVVITYGQEDLVDAAVDAALAQDYHPLEIVFSDDVSPDATFERLKARQAAYSGPHDFRVRQNAQNLGIVGNLCAAAEASSGDLIIVGAGDDLPATNRVSALVAAYEAGRDVMCLYSDVWETDQSGERIGRRTRRVPGTLEAAVRKTAFVLGASAAYDRRVFSEFGPIRDRVQSEDIVLYLRALILGRVAHIEEPLVSWQISPSAWKGTETDRIKRTGEKNGRLRALAYRQAEEDYRTYCTAKEIAPERAVLRALRAQIAECEGFAQLTRGRVGAFAAGALSHPQKAVANLRALRRYLRLRKK